MEIPQLTVEKSSKFLGSPQPPVWSELSAVQLLKDGTVLSYC